MPHFIYFSHDPATVSAAGLIVDCTDSEEEEVRQGFVAADEHSQTGWLSL